MNFDWNEYETLARFLAGDKSIDPEEITFNSRFRTSISRAYYASLHVAREFIEEYLHLTLKGDGSLHTKVIDTYRDDDDKTYKDIGFDLNRLRWLRVAADYEKSISDIESKTKDALEFAQNIIKNIESLKNSS